VGESRGEALWRLGRGRAAVHALLAGLPASGIGPPPPDGLPPRAPPLAGPLPRWGRDSALHDPARNLVLTGLLLHAMGRRDEALPYVDRALALGLAEAAHARGLIAP